MHEPSPAPRWSRWVPLLYLAFGVVWILASDWVVGWLFRDSPHTLVLVGTVKGFAFVSLTAVVLAIWWRLEQKRNAALVASAQAEASFATERMAWMGQHANEIMLLVDDDGRILDCNERAELVYRRTRAQLLAMRTFELRTPQEQSTSREQLQRILESGSLVFETQHVRSDGSTFPVEISARRVDFQGRRYVQSIVRDQTELVAARRRLERQRDLYELLSRCNHAVPRLHDRQSLYDAIVRLSVENGRFLFAWIAELLPDGGVAKSARFGADGGYVDRIEASARADSPAGQGLIGRSLRDGVTVVSNRFLADPATARVHELARAVGIEACAGVPFRRRGEVIGMLLVYSAEPDFFDPQIVETLEEIAEELGFGLEAQEIRKELDESRNLLQTVIDASAAPIYAFDRAGRALMINQAGARVLGKSREQLIGRTRAETWPAHSAAAHRDSDEQVFASGEPLYVEESFGPAGRERIFLSVKYPLRDLEGRVYAAGAISTEITDLRRAQRHVVESNTRLEETVARRTQELTFERDRAEKADRAKTAFLSTISHELRTPLNSIIGFTDIVLNGLSGPLNLEQRKQLGIVHESSRLLLDLINEMLDLSRIEAGRLQFNMEPFDLGDLLRRRSEAMRPQCDAKGLLLECDIADDVGTVVSDPKRVAQIVANLVSNAIKFTRTGRVTLLARASNQHVEIEVRDTGPGIPLEDMTNLFKPFMQGADAQRGHSEGAGLGLAISRHLARALGGDITVASATGEGCSFIVTLPRRSPAEPDTSDSTGLLQRLAAADATLGREGNSP